MSLKKFAQITNYNYFVRYKTIELRSCTVKIGQKSALLAKNFLVHLPEQKICHNMVSCAYCSLEGIAAKIVPIVPTDHSQIVPFTMPFIVPSSFPTYRSFSNKHSYNLL